MKKKKVILVTILILIIAAVYGWFYTSKDNNAADVTEVEEVEKVNPIGPTFNADSAFAYCATQCNFGPRIMNSEAHDKCADWIVAKFKQYGCTVEEQKADLKGYDGTLLKSNNIIASYNPRATSRILICAHWDSRPWADNDPDSTNWHKPVMAANDGASGVGVMLELARTLQANAKNPQLASKVKNLGIDFVCFDAEDWGTPSWSGLQDDESTWALGAQYWSTHLPQGYAPRYGILLDMVGGQGAQFYRERMSLQYAEQFVHKIWKASRNAGYGQYFPNKDGNYITDDHIPVNKNANIPTIDIIPYYPDCQQSSFGPTWHTISDDMDHLDKNVLKAVGQTLIQVIYTEMNQK